MFFYLMDKVSNQQTFLHKQDLFFCLVFTFLANFPIISVYICGGFS